MIKKFLLSMLGSMAALWLSMFLLIIFFLGLVGVLATSGKGGTTAEVKKGTVLLLDLSTPINERAVERNFKQLIEDEIQGADAGQNLNEITAAIYRAAHDTRIKGIYLTANGVSECGVASAQSIIEALDYFKKQPGKWVVAYGDSYDQANYYLASAANEIYLNPCGMVDIHGLAATTIFYAGLFEKLGVKMQVVKVGSFKSAVEPYILKEMSPASRLQQEVYLNSIWADMRSDIARGRNTTAAKVDQWASGYVACAPADSIVALGIVDQLLYRHQAEDAIAERVGEETYDDVNTLTMSEYAATLTLGDLSYLPDVKQPKGSKNTIAVLYAVGEIADSGDSGIIGNDVVQQIFDLIDDSDDLAGLVLRVNSPGGSAFASEQIWEALEQFKKQTDVPFYVSMGDVAASGGYYISCGADRIYAQPTTLTGSIGIFGLIPEIHGLLENHLGITTGTVATNADANFPSLLTPMSPTQQAQLQAYVERGYELFTSRVAQGRGMSQDSVKLIAEGRVWDGSLALKKGLVDRLGSLHTAVLDMASDLQLKEWQVKEYPSLEHDWWEELMKSNEFKIKASSPETLRLYQHLDRLMKSPRVQARCETIILR